MEQRARCEIGSLGCGDVPALGPSLALQAVGFLQALADSVCYLNSDSGPTAGCLAEMGSIADRTFSRRCCQRAVARGEHSLEARDLSSGIISIHLWLGHCFGHLEESGAKFGLQSGSGGLRIPGASWESAGTRHLEHADALPWVCEIVHAVFLVMLRESCRNSSRCG